MGKTFGVGLIVLALGLAAQLIVLMTVFPVDPPGWAMLPVFVSIFGAVVSAMAGLFLCAGELQIRFAPLSRLSWLHRRLDRLNQYEQELRHLSIPERSALVVTEKYIEEVERQRELLMAEIHDHELSRIAKRLRG